VAAVVDGCSTAGHWTSRPWAIGAWMRLSLAHVTDTRGASPTHAKPRRAGYQSRGRLAYRFAGPGPGRGRRLAVLRPPGDPSSQGQPGLGSGELDSPVIAAPYAVGDPTGPARAGHARLADCRTRSSRDTLSRDRSESGPGRPGFGLVSRDLPADERAGGRTLRAAGEPQCGQGTARPPMVPG